MTGGAGPSRELNWTEAVSAFLATERVAHLATVNADGSPHVVPICFAFDGHRFFSVIDQKPKRVVARQLRRIRNIVGRPAVSLVVDRYSEDWTQLGFVLVSGTGEVLWDGDEREAGLDRLRSKYPQYREMALAGQPMICITPLRVTSWGSLADE